MPSESSTNQAPSNEKPNVPAHPYSEFSDGRRRLVLSIVAVAGFFGPLAAGVYLPALPILVEEFNTSESTINATVSVFMVILAVAPLFWASRADYAGRKPLYMVSLSIYIVANVLLAAAPANLAALFILRVVQGFGGASVLSLGAGTVADIVAPKNRGAAMSLVLLGPQCGPVLGPILGGAIAGNASWRWIFGFLAIAASVLLLAVIIFLPETLRSIVGTGANYANSPLLIRPKWRQPNVVDHAKFPKPPAPTMLTLLKLLKSLPTVVMSLNGAILFSAYYAMTVTLPYYLENEYHFSPTEVGLACLASGAALVAGSMTSGRVSDCYRSHFPMSADDSPPHHDTRLHLQVPGMVLSLSGVLICIWDDMGIYHYDALPDGELLTNPSYACCTGQPVPQSSSCRFNSGDMATGVVHGCGMVLYRTCAGGVALRASYTLDHSDNNEQKGIIRQYVTS
ncbi:hypothetical protein GTA08_BOTSDO04859 [Botryosphaeria dothidea]|uniref:Major facilitator superfamily (MFS) profile domain-containing protein n=1 Tax=Botryosphaeria dothidea TaxID=55169 RepID=A0A8H4IT48_9PEZI|nr:hypothetical protein GTA08_BOTSDO04859 [Botryosphaeria dothidea]